MVTCSVRVFAAAVSELWSAVPDQGVLGEVGTCIRGGQHTHTHTHTHTRTHTHTHTHTHHARTYGADALGHAVQRHGQVQEVVDELARPTHGVARLTHGVAISGALRSPENYALQLWRSSARAPEANPDIAVVSE